MSWTQFKARLAIFWFPFLLLLILTVAWSPLNAAPVAKAEKNGVTIILYDEPCKLDAVTNLEYRATWTEPGKTFEGCFTVIGGIVVTYWREDKTIGLIPPQAFAPLTGS